MTVYADLAALLNFLVDFLLILGTNRLAGYPVDIPRALAAAGLGGVYAFACLFPGWAFLAEPLWLMVSLVLICAIAFGLNRSAVRRGMLFVFLSFALSGAAMGMNTRSFPALLFSAASVCLLCIVGFGGGMSAASYVPVILCSGGKKVSLTALRDTGNALQDPVTGESVLVVGPEVAKTLLGLDRKQLSAPVETVSKGVVPGLRLIPYRSVGQPGGLLVAIRIQEATIGKRRGSALVAFAPNGFENGGTYQALTGGALL